MAILFRTPDGEFNAENDGKTLIDQLALAAGVPVDRRCGGKGVCKKCLADLGPGRYLVNGREITVHEGHELEALSCQAVALSDAVTVTFPFSSLFAKKAQIHADFSVRSGGGNGDGLAVACDIGTTTVVCVLVDVRSGEVLARASKYNQQIRLADDVASRISICSEPGMVEEMRRLVIEETVNPLIAQLCAESGRKPEEISAFIASGNTVMEHLFAGLSPESIGQVPFTPQVRVFETCTAEQLGIAIAPGAAVELMPCISGYVGGDITADIFVTDLHTKVGIMLLVDIGTNGEIVLTENGRMLATATAAGPAFEGAGITHGCRASDGAIEKIAFRAGGQFELSVIGGGKAAGICGSAIIDFLALLHRHDWLTPTGRFDLDVLKEHGVYLQVEENGTAQNACLLVPAEEARSGDPIYVTEKDVSEILKAKAAIYAGMQTLLSAAGRTFSDLDRLILAGGFANYIDLPNAMAIGLLPELEIEDIEVIGNGSLAGAYLATLNPAVLASCKNVIDEPDTIELNRREDFEDNFIDALLLP